VHVVIMGCGRVGSALAHNLEAIGHTVAVIDQNAHAFRRLGPDYRGRKVHGSGFSRETLEAAGTGEATAFAAVSSGDNSNIIAARVARETFGVHHVAARIYDPRRAEIYTRLGIPTVATVRWTAEQMQRLLLPAVAHDHWHDPSGSVRLTEIPVDEGWVGHPITALEAASGTRVGCILRYGDGMVPEPDTVMQSGDVVYVMVRGEQAERAADILAHPPVEDPA
jgi:trk system potassium uptake protein TrkA